MAKDGDDFNCDISHMNWDEYIKHYMIGIRKYVLKDNVDSMESARKTVKRYYNYIIYSLYLTSKC